MEDKLIHRSVDDIDGQRLTSLLLCLGRILIVFQHLLLLVTPATRPSGTYRSTYTCTTVFYSTTLCKRSVCNRSSVRQLSITFVYYRNGNTYRTVHNSSSLNAYVFLDQKLLRNSQGGTVSGDVKYR